MPGPETGEAAAAAAEETAAAAQPGICHQSDLSEQSGNAGTRLGRFNRPAHTPPIVLATALVNCLHDSGIYTFRDLFAIYLSLARSSLFAEPLRNPP